VSRNGPRALERDRVCEQQNLLLAFVEAAAMKTSITFGKNPNFCSSACNVGLDFSGADSIV